MNAEGYLDDFDRFLREGRIGSPAARLDVLLDSGPLTPDVAEIRGEVVAERSRIRSLAWRMRGDREWNRIHAQVGRFAFAGPGRQGIVEIRCTGVAEPSPEALVAWAFVELAWPAPVVSVVEGERSTPRYGDLRARLDVNWIESLQVFHADGSGDPMVQAGGRSCGVEIPLRSSDVGQHEVQVRWRGCDGSEGACDIHYEVTARPIALEVFARRGGGLIYRTACVDAIELVIPGQADPIPVPANGVIESSFLVPIRASLRYRDEASQWHSETLVLDQPPRTWSRLPGFRHP